MNRQKPTQKIRIFEKEKITKEKAKMGLEEEKE